MGGEVGVRMCVNRHMQEKSEELQELMEDDKEEIRPIIGGDLNVRTEGRIGREWRGDPKRKSKVKILNGEEKNCLRAWRRWNGLF